MRPRQCSLPHATKHKPATRLGATKPGVATARGVLAKLLCQPGPSTSKRTALLRLNTHNHTHPGYCICGHAECGHTPRDSLRHVQISPPALAPNTPPNPTPPVAPATTGNRRQTPPHPARLDPIPQQSCNSAHNGALCMCRPLRARYGAVKKADWRCCTPPQAVAAARRHSCVDHTCSRATLGVAAALTGNAGSSWVYATSSTTCHGLLPPTIPRVRTQRT